MDNTYISFYLTTGRIHVFITALRSIGSPRRICFMISENGKSLILSPYNKLDFRSHGVPKGVYNGKECFEISSMKLCGILAELLSWDTTKSYRVPGRIVKKPAVVVFDLTKAEQIKRMGPPNA